MKPRFLCLVLFLLCLSTGEAQNLIIPQIVDGGGWQTTIVLTNTSASATTASLAFFEENGGSNTQTWNLSFLETSTPQNLSLPAAGTLFLHTPGTAGTTSVGWAQLQANSSVVAYAIFTQTVPGRPNQDGTANAGTASSRILIPYDNTNGNVTAVALANPGAASESLTAGIQPSSGSSSQPSPMTLPAQGHTSFTMPQQFPTTAGQSGLLELNSASGTLSGLALRFNPTGGFTTAPVYAESGATIIGGSSGGTLPQFSSINISGSSSSGVGQIVIGFPVTGGGYSYGSVQGMTSSFIQYQASWNNITANGQTLTFSGLQAGGMQDAVHGTSAVITSSTLTVTLSPQTSTTVSQGTVSGTLTLVSTLATVSTSFTGTYIAQ